METKPASDQAGRENAAGYRATCGVNSFKLHGDAGHCRNKCGLCGHSTVWRENSTADYLPEKQESPVLAWGKASGEKSEPSRIGYSGAPVLVFNAGRH